MNRPLTSETRRQRRAIASKIHVFQEKAVGCGLWAVADPPSGVSRLQSTAHSLFTEKTQKFRCDSPGRQRVFYGPHAGGSLFWFRHCFVIRALRLANPTWKTLYKRNHSNESGYSP